MPDWLWKHAPYEGTRDEADIEDEEFAAERSVLESCTRMLGCGESTPELRAFCKPPAEYRNAASPD